MPRIMGVNLGAALAAAIAMYVVGFLFYGLVFGDLWTRELLEDRGIVAQGAASALSTAELEGAMRQLPQNFPVSFGMALGFVISLVSAIALAAVLNLVKPASLGASLGIAVLLWAGFAVTTAAYDPVYAGASPTMYAIDFFHMLCGYLAGAATIHLIDARNWRTSAA